MELKKLEEEEEKKARQQSLTLNFLHPFPDIVHRLRERTKFAFANIFISLKTLRILTIQELTNIYIYIITKHVKIVLLYRRVANREGLVL